MNKLDASLEDIENTRFLTIYSSLVRKLSKKTQFTESELKYILLVYHKFVLANGSKAKKMKTNQLLNLFLVFFKIYDFKMIERIIIVLSNDLLKEIDPVTWVKLFDLFMSKDLEKRMKFTYQVYTCNSSAGLIDREIVTLGVQNFFGQEEEDEINEMRLEMVDHIFRVFDADKDGVITFDEYAEVVRKRPMLLEFLGPCFPPTSELTVISICVGLLDRIKDPAITETPD